MLTILLLVLLVALFFGGFGHTREWGYVSWSPAAIVLVVIAALLLFGHLR